MPKARSRRHSPARTVVLTIAMALAIVGCKRSPPTPTPAASAAPPAPAPARATVTASDESLSQSHGESAQADARTREVAVELGETTFVVASDTHFGFGGVEEVNDSFVRRIRALPGKPWPKPIDGTVAALEGVIITGDLTEWGRPEEWQRFLAFYGGPGTDARLTLPVFEMIGNHDKVAGPWVESQVAARHGGRFYGWTWRGLRLIALGEAPDDEGLAFLAKELAALPKGTPVMIFFHLALVGPWTENWFGNGDYKGRLARALAGANVIAIVHGHQHAHGHDVWQGFDVLKPGAAKHGDHSLVVARVARGKLSVAWLDADRGAWIASFEKAVAR